MGQTYRPLTGAVVGQGPVDGDAPVNQVRAVVGGSSEQVWLPGIGSCGLEAERHDDLLEFARTPHRREIGIEGVREGGVLLAHGEVGLTRFLGRDHGRVRGRNLELQAGDRCLL